MHGRWRRTSYLSYRAGILICKIISLASIYSAFMIMIILPSLKPTVFLRSVPEVLQ